MDMNNEDSKLFVQKAGAWQLSPVQKIVGLSFTRMDGLYKVFLHFNAAVN
jgi:hypothetical protein